MFSLRRQFEAHSENKSLSNDGVRQLILAYRADKSGAVIPGWQPKKGFLYTQVRAISARINQNYDAWPSTELKKSYRTFLGKPVFVNHNNFDPSRARGRVIAARYVEAGNDKYVEVIQEIDAQRFPKLASEIRSGGLDSVSMGVEAGFTICSYCNNKATDAHDMCDHVKYHKGEKLRKHNHRTGKIEDVMVYENCYKLGFFELSYVFDPADETAVVSKVLVANRKRADNYIDPSDVGPVANDPKPALSVPMYVPGQTYGEDNEAVQMPPIVTPFGKGSEPAGEATHAYHSGFGDHGAIGGGGSEHAIGGGSEHAQASGLLGGGGYSDKASRLRLKRAFGEVKAPEAVNTLRNRAKEVKKEDFKHWVESPEELQDPDTSKADRLQRRGLEREVPAMGNVARRRHAGFVDTRDLIEQYLDINESGPYASDSDDGQAIWDELETRAEQGDPDANDFLYESIGDPPVGKGSRMSKRAGRRFYAEDEESESAEPEGDSGGGEEAPEEGGGEGGGDPQELVADYLAWCDQSGAAPGPDTLQAWGQEAGLGPDELQAVFQVIQAVIAQVSQAEGGGGAPGPEQAAPQGDPAAQQMMARRRHQNTRKGNGMSGSLADRGRVASRGMRHFADDSGLTDGGPYGENDQGEQEEVFITQTPGEEPVAAPVPGDGTISNTENTLVAKVLRGTEQLKRDTAKLQAFRNARRRRADVISAPGQDEGSLGNPSVGEAAGFGETGNFTGGGGPLTPSGYGAGAQATINSGQAARGKAGRRRQKWAADGGLPDADSYSPELSGTDEQDLQSPTEDLQPDKVETQPRDASLKAFAAFDHWLRQTTGRTARQHNPNFLRRQAARWAKSQGAPVEILFPTLRNVLREARKVEKEAKMRRHADESLDVAAPQDRIDVEAPVTNVTDEEAQASQFDLQDFGNNAGDNLAEPDLDTGSQIWAPGEGERQARRADAVAAVRLAEAYIKAGLTPEDEKWKLIASFQTMRHATVVDRTRLLENVIQANASRRKVTAGNRRGTVTRSAIPAGLSSRGRVASTTRTATNDPSFDCTLFL